MSRQSIGQKAERALKLLLGLRNPRIAAALASHGFTEDDLREGWDRLAALTRMRLAVRVPLKDPRVIKELDEFENTFFRVAHATLDHRFPEVSASLFLNLTQTTGDGVAISVATFLERLAAMAKGEKPYGERGVEARKLLAERGLTEDRVRAAEALLTSLSTIVEEPLADVPRDEQLAAEEALWAWYLEWSEIARVAIRDGRLLRTLGFLQRRGDLVEEAPVAEVALTPSPTPALASTPAAPALPASSVVRREDGVTH